MLLFLVFPQRFCCSPCRKSRSRQPRWLFSLGHRPGPRRTALPAALPVQEGSLPRLLGAELLGSLQRGGQGPRCRYVRMSSKQAHLRCQYRLAAVKSPVFLLSCSLSAGARLGYVQATPTASMTGGLVAEQAHVVLPSVPPLATLVLTVLAMLVGRACFPEADEAAPNSDTPTLRSV